MITPGNGDSALETMLNNEQLEINENRLGLINALGTFKPPESTKTAVYKWFDSISEHSKRMDQINTNYVTKLRLSNEESNQKIINQMEQLLKYLIENKIINMEDSKEVLEQKLLPIWSKKQKGIEEYIEKIEVSFSLLQI
jgi:hypothetical protein